MSIFGKLKKTNLKLSELFPHEWVEKNRVMTKEVSPIPGKFSYENSPYVRGIVDCLDQRTPGKVYGIMKGAQIGMSTGLMEGGIGWIMANDPGNILFLVGHSDLIADATSKVDVMIANSGLSDFIASNSQRKRNIKSGNTDTLKEFPMGSLKINDANHKKLRSFSVRYGFIDDYESMKGSTEQSGSTEALIEQRFASYKSNKKIFYISTPELEEHSNIYKVYLKGDQRKYHIPCECCGDFIVLEWEIESNFDGSRSGIVYDLDDNNRLITGSVRYRCQMCNGEFTDGNKKQFLNNGKWIPTAIPVNEDYVSFHISALYAPIYMDDWEKYVVQYLDACPPGGQRKESEYKSFRNLCLGLPYKVPSSKMDAKSLMKSQRGYKPGIIPQSVSEMDGNGKIIMLTMGVDIGGIELDGRLDYEIVGWSESGASYSIDHGSIGTYQPREKTYIDRLRQPVDITKADNVFLDLISIMQAKFEFDNEPDRKVPIMCVAIDHGHLASQVETFFSEYEKMNTFPKLIMVKGDKDHQRLSINNDIPWYKNSRNMPNKLFILNGNTMKTILAQHMRLIWRDSDEKQPAWYLNFPQSEDGKYLYSNFFSHFEAEEQVIDSKTFMYRWEKKSGAINHQFDCRLYSMAARDIFMNEFIFKPEGIKRGTWSDFVRLLE